MARHKYGTHANKGKLARQSSISHAKHTSIKSARKPCTSMHANGARRIIPALFDWRAREKPTRINPVSIYIHSMLINQSRSSTLNKDQLTSILSYWAVYKLNKSDLWALVIVISWKGNWRADRHNGEYWRDLASTGEVWQVIGSPGLATFYQPS